MLDPALATMYVYVIPPEASDLPILGLQTGPSTELPEVGNLRHSYYLLGVWCQWQT